MTDGILDETLLTESELPTLDEKVINLLQDIAADNLPGDLAEEFIEEFVLQDRPETAQLLAMLDQPSEVLVEVLKGIVGQSYQVQMEALDLRGVSFINGLKLAVKEKMTALANNNS